MSSVVISGSAIGTITMDNPVTGTITIADVVPDVETATIPDPVAVVVTIPSVTIANQASQTVIPDPVAIVVTVPSATVANQVNQTVIPDPVAVVVTIPEPTITEQTESVIPDAVEVVVTIPEPTVANQANQTVTPDPVAVVLTVQEPTIANQSNVAVTPDPVAVVVTIPEPVIANQANQTVTPDPVEVVVTLPSVTIANQSNQTVIPDAVAVVATVKEPTVANQANQTVIPDPAAVVVTVQEPTIANEGGDYHPPITANLEAEFTFGLSAMYQDSSGTGDLAEETDPVGYWEDLSGNVNPAIQGTTADKPVAGASFITFDNGSDHLEIDALAAFMTAAGAWSMYMVSDPTADVNSMWRAWNSGNDNYIEFIFPYINPGSGFDYFPRMSQKGSGYINVTSAAAATFDKRLYTFVCNGTTIKVYENGSLIITLTYTGTPPALDRFQISVTFPQNVYRCYFYSAGHDDTDRGTMETSIMSEEGI
jgi:hypothetical protein